MPPGRILIVEDEDKLRRVMQLHLESAGFEVDSAATAEQALPLATQANLVITDLRLPGMDGMRFVQQLQSRSVQAGIIVITAHGTVETAVEAMKMGAADFLQKPFSLDHLTTVVQKAMAVQFLRAENQRLRDALDTRYQFANIVGRSPAMREIFQTVERVAPTRATVLLAGESGVGKDMIGRAIHQHSPRKNQPYVKINCTAIPENLMESELFGYEKGAFTGANSSKPGKFEQADGGTVFLDEIGDVPGNIQVKLLRILQERQFERLGSNLTRTADVRVIAATNVDLRAALEEGRFREDLYYRLNVVPINIPPLAGAQRKTFHFSPFTLFGNCRRNSAPSVVNSALARSIVCSIIHGRAMCASSKIPSSEVLFSLPAKCCKQQTFDSRRREPPTRYPTTQAPLLPRRRNPRALGTNDDQRSNAARRTTTRVRRPGSWD